jgi:Leucine-rich repeat (LRR) protein
MTASLDRLSSADRGFVTWLAGMVREPIESVWGRLHSPVSSTKIDGEQIVSLDLSVIGAAMRAVVGPQRKLSLPVAGLDGVTELDCSGLDLDMLDVRALPNLRLLRCANNRLRELDLTQCPRLEVLECQGNAMMVLDLRANPSLREVDCSGNGLGALVLPSPSRLVELDCSRNQLMVLDLGVQPELVELRCFRNALVRLELGLVPRLARLDASRNELPRFSFEPAPSLTMLHVGRNRIGELDVSSLEQLQDLRCQGNYIGQLDLRACTALEFLDASDNQLELLLLGDKPRLGELLLVDNRLEVLRLQSLSLEILTAARNPLRELSLDCPGLRALDVSEASLSALDLSSAPSLIELRCAGTPLRSLDLSPCGELLRVELQQERVQLRMTDAQQQRLVSLRPRRTGPLDLAQLDAWELHDLAWRALAWRGVASPRMRTSRDGEDLEQLHQIARAPQVDLGTLRMMYWTSAPQRYLRYRTREEVPIYQRAGWDLLATIEARVTSGDWQATIPFDPRQDRHTRSVRGVDWTIERPGETAEIVREIPPPLR